MAGDEQLLLIDIINASGGVVIVQTIWAPAENIRYGRRETRTERVKTQAQLRDRLIELVPLIAGELPLRPPAAELGDNVVVVDMGKAAAA